MISLHVIAIDFILLNIYYKLIDLKSSEPGINFKITNDKSFVIFLMKKYIELRYRKIRDVAIGVFNFVLNYCKDVFLNNILKYKLLKFRKFIPV